MRGRILALIDYVSRFQRSPLPFKPAAAGYGSHAAGLADIRPIPVVPGATGVSRGATEFSLDDDRQAEWVAQLTDPAAYPHPVAEIEHLETHISHIFLTGRFAYKIKKAIDLGFLDFSQLEWRRFYCHEELRLNRRLAPALYREVVPIVATANGVRVGGAGPAVEYAIKMLEFPQSALLDGQMARGVLSAAQIDRLVDRVTVFHRQAARADFGDDYGTAKAVWKAVSQTLEQLRAGLDPAAGEAILLTRIETWAQREFDRLKGRLAERRQAGCVRECHGDLHLGNIAWWLDGPQIFDGIEFNPNLRWIDVISEVAFTHMDLAVRGRPDYAWRFLNRYLENTGDYAGLELLPFYTVYRALVRAMVAGIRTAQQGAGEAAGHAAERRRYLAYAERATYPRTRQLILMHGFSGAGKTTVAQSVLEASGAIRLRSDVERKRVAGPAAVVPRGGALERGIYDAETTRSTYQRLVQLARQVLDAGLPVLIDAASLKGWQREIFRSQARAQRVPFRIISCRADEALLYERLHTRQAAANDASDAGPAVLKLQLESSEPLTPAEQQECLVVDSDKADTAQLLRWLAGEGGW